jgi:chromosomal replication initiator protein
MKHKHEDVWYNCLQIIKDNIPKTSFDTWFRRIVPMRLEQNVLTIQVPSTFYYEYLEEHYIDLLKSVLRKELGKDAKLEYQVVIDATPKNDDPITVKYPIGQGTDVQNRPVQVPVKDASVLKNPFVIPGIKRMQINPQLKKINTFENFVEGECNQLARSAGMAIAASPGSSSFNPLFIYGEPAVGKTHLAQAVGIGVKENFPEKIVLYVSANTFQTQYTEAAKNNNRNDFMHFYQMIDVLIIDDVNEFAGKTATQETFFHIFNHLHQNGKQLIMTSDRPPMELKSFSDRLLSRFKWGLTVEIGLPDEETRKAIFRKKAYNEGIELPPEVLEHLSRNINGNVREIEGAILYLMAHSTFLQKKIDLDTARQVTAKQVKEKRTEYTIPYIIKIITSYFDLENGDLQTKSRKREIVQARQLAMFFSKKLTKSSLSSIGAEIGGKDHATVLHSCRTVEALYQTDKMYKVYFEDIERKLISA